jgi:hypothetical protein
LMLACGAGLPAEAPKSAPDPATPVQGAPAAPVVQAPATKEAPVDDGFEAVVRIDEKPGGKKFQGVWLERPDGERWVVAYRPEEWLRSFEGRTVRVTGETYQPKGQAISATHYRVRTLQVADKKGGHGPLFGMGPEQTLRGKFKQKKVPRGAKNEGDLYWTFVAADGADYMLEHIPEGVVDGAAVEIVARAVEPDWSYMARRGGDYLWVLAVESPATD